MQSEQLVDVQQALARSADDLTSSQPGLPTAGDQRLERLTRAALDNVPGTDYVVLTMREQDGGLASYAPTSPDIEELDRLQVSLGEGPCLDAVAAGTSTVIDVPDFAAETTRWPRFCAAASSLGIGSLISFGMAPDGAVPGAVNFYSRSTDGFDETARVIAGAFAMQAAVAVYGAQRISSLERALATRDLIGQAKVILMERHHATPERAFDMLVGASQDTNMKLVDVARWLTGEVAGTPSG